MQALNHYLSQRLKTLRSDRGWSLDKTASHTGVSKAMLGQIERGESSPTVATLWKIATGFHVSLSSLLEPIPEQNEGITIRSADHLRQQTAQGEMLVASLFPYEAQYGFEMFELTIQPGYQRLSDPHDPGVTEHIVVLEGQLDIMYRGQWETLSKGAAIRFPADTVHGYRNTGADSAVFLDLISYPATTE